MNNQNFYTAIRWILILIIAAAALTWFNSCTVNKYYVVVQPIKEHTVEKVYEYPSIDPGFYYPINRLTLTPNTAPNPLTFEDVDLFDLAIDTAPIADEWIIIGDNPTKNECDHLCFSAVVHTDNKCCKCGKKL